MTSRRWSNFDDLHILVSYSAKLYYVRSTYHHHHHRVHLLLVEHAASMKSFQALHSPAVPLTSIHDLPVFLISSSIVLCHVLFGLPLLLYPWGFRSSVVFSIARVSLHNVCPNQFHFLLFIWNSIGFCLVILLSMVKIKNIFSLGIETIIILWYIFYDIFAYNRVLFSSYNDSHNVTLLVSFSFLIAEPGWHTVTWWHIVTW